MVIALNHGHLSAPALAPRAGGLTICIPVLNEEAAIGATVERCLALREPLKAMGVAGLQVIVVDDGSVDNTAAEVQRFQGVRLIRHPCNLGYGAALKTGFDAASFDLIGFIDADATYPPEEFPALCRVILDHGADHVVGSRMAGAKSEMPVTRRAGNLFFARLLSMLSGTRVTDSASGMRVFRRAALDVLMPLPDGLNFTPVMSTRAMHEGISTIEVPIPYCERVGRSHLRITSDGLRFLRTMIWTALTYNPVRPMGLVGVSALGVAGAIGAGLVALRGSGVDELGPTGVYAAFVALVAAVAGVSVFGVGAAFNYLVSLFYKRPIRQGLFGRPLLRRPVEHVFLPLGVTLGVIGTVASVISLVLARSGWPIERLWLHLTASAVLILVGLQLCLSWLVLSVLGELAERAWAEQKTR